MALGAGGRQVPNMPNGKAARFYRFPEEPRQIFIPMDYRFAMIATVNREKGPKMKMAQEVLRHS
jgi:hypothetical protein